MSEAMFAEKSHGFPWFFAVPEAEEPSFVAHFVPNTRWPTVACSPWRCSAQSLTFTMTSVFRRLDHFSGSLKFSHRKWWKWWKWKTDDFNWFYHSNFPLERDFAAMMSLSMFVYYWRISRQLTPDHMNHQATHQLRLRFRKVVHP